MTTKTSDLSKPFDADRRQYDSAPGLTLASFQARAVGTYGTAIFLGILILFSATLSVGILSKQSIRLDEAQSLWQTRQEPMQILNTIAEDVHVPLYHMLLHFWRVGFGENIAVARTLSLLFFLGTIPAMYFVGRAAFNSLVGMFAAFLTAISPFLNWYGNEARMYSMLTLLSLINQYFFLQIFRTNDKRAWIGYGITAVVGMYTHYFFAFALLAQAVFYVAYRSHFQPGTLKKFIQVAAIVLVSMLPWLAFVYSMGAASNTRPQIDLPTSVNLFNTFSEFIFGFQSEYLNTAIVSMWPVLVLLGFFSLRRNKSLDPEAAYFILALLVPIASAFLLSFVIQPFYLARYLIFALPSLYLLVSWLFSTYPQRLAFALKSLLILAMLFTLTVQLLSPDTPVKEEYYAATTYLNKESKPQDVIIVSAPFTIYPIEYYYTGTSRVDTLPIWNRYITGPIPPFSEEKLPAEVARLKGSHQRAFLLLSYDQGYEQKVKDYFDTHFERLEAKEYSNGLNLYVYKLRYDQLEVANAFQRTLTGSTMPQP
jgi:mannosyltransferase